MKSQICIFLIGLLVLDVFAQVPRTMSFMGRLTDGEDLPIIGSVELDMSIYDSATGGSALWSESQTATANEMGNIAVILGESTPLNIPFDTQYYLEITVDGELLPERISLTANAYSLSSINSINGISATNGNIPFTSEDIEITEVDGAINFEIGELDEVVTTINGVTPVDGDIPFASDDLNITVVDGAINFELLPIDDMVTSVNGFDPIGGDVPFTSEDIIITELDSSIHFSIDPLAGIVKSINNHKPNGAGNFNLEAGEGISINYDSLTHTFTTSTTGGAGYELPHRVEFGTDTADGAITVTSSLGQEVFRVESGSAGQGVVFDISNTDSNAVTIISDEAGGSNVGLYVDNRSDIAESAVILADGTCGMGIYAVIEPAEAASRNSSAIYGTNYEEDEVSFGVVGECSSEEDNSAGVYGLSFSNDGASFGVMGETNSDDNDAAGVYGVANGDRSIGVLAEAKGENFDARGLFAKVDAGRGVPAHIENNSDEDHTKALIVEHNCETGYQDGIASYINSPSGNAIKAIAGYDGDGDAIGIYASTAANEGIAVYANGGQYGVNAEGEYVGVRAEGDTIGVLSVGPTAFKGYGNVHIKDSGLIMSHDRFVYDVESAELSMYSNYNELLTKFGGLDNRVAIQKVNGSATPTIPDNNFSITADAPLTVTTSDHGVNISCEECGGGGGFGCAYCDDNVMTVGHGDGTPGEFKVVDCTGGYTFWQDNLGTSSATSGSFDGDLHVGGDIYGSSKHFVAPHPEIDGMDIVFTSTESDQVNIEHGGLVQLEDGYAEYELPNEFKLMADSETYRVLCTPQSIDTPANIGAEVSQDGIVKIRDFNGGNIQVAFNVTAIRDGYQDFEVIQAHKDDPLRD